MAWQATALRTLSPKSHKHLSPLRSKLQAEALPRGKLRRSSARQLLSPKLGPRWLRGQSAEAEAWPATRAGETCPGRTGAPPAGPVQSAQREPAPRSGPAAWVPRGHRGQEARGSESRVPSRDLSSSDFLLFSLTQELLRPTPWTSWKDFVEGLEPKLP